jgi:hypothetical protein
LVVPPLTGLARISHQPTPIGAAYYQVVIPTATK